MYGHHAREGGSSVFEGGHDGGQVCDRNAGKRQAFTHLQLLLVTTLVVFEVKMVSCAALYSNEIGV